MTILEKIIANKKKEVETKYIHKPLEEIKKEADFERGSLSMVDALTVKGSSGIIAEFKTMSPSKGILNATADVEWVTRKYLEAGAAGLSVLTDSVFFGGSFDNLKMVRRKNECPILQKDFIIDEYQIAEAYINGADVILLIAAVLDKKKIKLLAKVAKEYGMEVILEIHEKSEIDMLTGEVDIAGINNRNLRTFETSVDKSFSLVKHIPRDFIKISESGLYDADTIMKLKEAGFSGFLIGEQFMREPDPGEACYNMIKQLSEREKYS